MPVTEISMPSNIALIKYMGKKDEAKTIPANASLSYTLPHLKTTVRLTPVDATADRWDEACHFNDAEKVRFLSHLNFLRQHHPGMTKQHFKLYSENNFPAGCGLASSASSFAALTKCAFSAWKIQLSIEEMASLSRQGSGSSCRSFFSPLALWGEEKVEAVPFPYKNLIHHVIVVSQHKKNISSSEAHRRVQTSRLFNQRKQNAEARLENLLKSFAHKDWEKSYLLLWQEFWEMHALFETAEKPFGYLLPESLFVLNTLRDYWQSHGDGPWITMDAGPNVHVLFREDQEKEVKWLKGFFSARFLVL